MSEHQIWKKVRSTETIDLKLFRAHFEFLINPRNEKEVKIVRLHARDACNVVCLDEDERILLVRQLRFGSMTYTLELPGGLVDEGESPLTAAKRELEEETGHLAEEWVYMREIYSNAVYKDSKVFHWLAKGAKKHKALKLDDAEDISLVWLTQEEVLAAMRDGTLDHPHTLSALGHYFLFMKKPLGV